MISTGRDDSSRPSACSADASRSDRLRVQRMTDLVTRRTVRQTAGMPGHSYRSAVASLGRNLLHTPGFARELAGSGIRRDSRPAVPTRHLLDAYPEADAVEVELGTVRYRLSNLDPSEQYVLGALARLRPPQRAFEIGTYDGASTLLLARNAPKAEIFTLDLPPSDAASATLTEEASNAAEGVGSRFRSTPEATRIIQLLGDSRTFDFSPWYGSVDLVIVDGGHELGCTRPDTANALRLLRPGGVVVWDDYTPGWPDVVRAVDELPADVHRCIVHIDQTGFAIYDRARFG